MSEDYKECRVCKENKPLEAFVADKRRADGKGSSCKICETIRTKKWKQSNRDKVLIQSKAYNERTKDKYKPVKKLYRDANKETMKQYNKNWVKLNRDKHRATGARRRSRLANATPKWLTETQQAEIKHFYWSAEYIERLTGYKIHVDHIIPLKGKNISGLHVPWNLQLLTGNENLVKGNRYE